MLTAIIMAGGSGERFWPLSTKEKPKQLLKIFSEKTMIRETVDRIIPIIDADKIFIATNEVQAEAIKKELPDIPVENIIIEPFFKDTAAAIGYASLIIEKRFNKQLKSGEKIVVSVLASDHLIEKKEEFRTVLIQAAGEAEEKGTIVTLGIKPIKPETAYGYIELDHNLKFSLNTLYEVKKFREKPNKCTAEEYLDSGRYLWNSGIFIFTTETIFKSYEEFMEEHSKIFNGIKKELDEKMYGLNLTQKVKNHFEKFKKISIDFGIMEHSKNIKVIPVEIGWNDIGSFNALEEIYPKNKAGNIVKNADYVELDSSENIIIGDGSKIALLGVENLIVVKNGENILIAHKERSQDIKKLIGKYEEKIEY